MPGIMKMSARRVSDAIGLALNYLLVIGVLLLPTRKASHPQEVKGTNPTSIRANAEGTAHERARKKSTLRSITKSKTRHEQVNLK